MGKWAKEHGLLLANIALFVIFFGGMILSGASTYSDEQMAHGEPAVTVLGYLGTGAFLEATFENWESEFLQMGMYVVLAALTTATILLPVSVHRRLFRQGLKATLVASADTIAKFSLAGVALLSVGTTSLIFDVTVGRTAGVVAGVGLLVVLVLLLVVVPAGLRRKGRQEDSP